MRPNGDDQNGPVQAHAMVLATDIDKSSLALATSRGQIVVAKEGHFNAIGDAPQPFDFRA